MEYKKPERKEVRKVVYCGNYYCNGKPFALLKSNPDRGDWFYCGTKKSAHGIEGSFDNFDLVFDDRAREEFEKYLNGRKDRKKRFDDKGLTIRVCESSPFL